jgi:hypothetical protein
MKVHFGSKDTEDPSSVDEESDEDVKLSDIKKGKVISKVSTTGTQAVRNLKFIGIEVLFVSIAGAIE